MLTSNANIAMRFPQPTKIPFIFYFDDELKRFKTKAFMRFSFMLKHKFCIYSIYVHDGRRIGVKCECELWKKANDY